jgi:hypothetical protein
MKNLMARSNGIRLNSGRLIAALTLGAVIGLAAGPVLADNGDGNRGRNEQHHGWNGRDRDEYRGYDNDGYRAYDYYGSTRYIYAPPPVVYVPYPPPPIEFIFQIR